MKNKTLIIFAFLGLAILLVSCGGESKKPVTSEPIKVSVRQEWFPNANFAGELVAMNETAGNHGIDLTIAPGADDVDPIKLVIGGSNDFGVAGADKVLLANEKGADLVIIGVINYDSPTVFLTKADSGIQKPKDFEGKTVGVLTGTATEYVYRTLLKTAAVEATKLKEVEAPFDLATFIAGKYDVRPAFAYDEPISLESKGIKFNVIKPSDYGVEFLGTVYFTTRKMIKERPEVVQSFITSVKEGWEATIKDPEKAIRYLKAFDPTIDETRELASLKKGMPYFLGRNGRVLTADPQHWQAMAKNLVELKALVSSDLKDSIDNSFVERAFQASK